MPYPPTAYSDGFESGSASAWSGGGSGATLTFPTGSAYEGTRHLHCSIASGSGTRFARCILTATEISLSENDDIYFGYAVKLASNFYTISRGASVRLTTIDNFTVTSVEDRLGLWIYSDDTVRVLRHKEDVGDTTLINLGAEAIPAGVWVYVEQRFLLSPTNGVARSEIWFDGISQGSTTTANLQGNFEQPFQRFRGGIGDVSGTTDGVIVVEFDKFYVDSVLQSAGTGNVISPAGGVSLTARAPTPRLTVPSPVGALTMAAPAPVLTTARTRPWADVAIA